MPILFKFSLIKDNLFLCISNADTCPEFFMFSAMCVVFPPGALQRSKTFKFGFKSIDIAASIALSS